MYSWFSGEAVVQGWGTWRHWLLALFWTFWLLLLILKDTGDDYLHVTKRFGIVAASQLPIHYLLAVKAWSPIQYITRMSHEELNPYHRNLGRIIVILMACHAFLYLNFYVQKGFLGKRIQDRDVILGLCAISSAIILFTTALASIRTYNYRLFFYIHVILSMALLPILYFHVSHIRLFILETAAIYVLLVIQRNACQARVEATISRLQGTNLISIIFPLPTPGSCSYAPGQHVYVTFPTLKDKLRLNPFTVANLPNEDRKILLMARALAGTTSMLDHMARSSQPATLLVEGPYGAATYFPQLADYDSVLLVAGGVGATFTMPIYQQLLKLQIGNGKPNNLRFVWAVRDPQDAVWATQRLRLDSGNLPDEFELYVTGHRDRGHSTRSVVDNDTMEIELQERETLLADASETADGTHENIGKDNMRSGRPDLGRLVDQTFTQKGGDKIAVLVCGPQGMGTALRKEVGRWILSGRDVFWHSEEFGW